MTGKLGEQECEESKQLIISLSKIWFNTPDPEKPLQNRCGSLGNFADFAAFWTRRKFSNKVRFLV
jgi:hypothetical protein